MASRERQSAGRGVFRGLTAVALAHPDLDGWKPLLGSLYAAAGAVADVVEVRADDTPGDIDGQRRLIATVVVKEPGRGSVRWDWPYRPADAADGAEPLRALRSDFERRLKTKDLAGLSQSVAPQNMLRVPAELPNHSARKAFHSLVQIERGLEAWDRFFADRPHGPAEIANLRQLVEDAYRVGRWAREMELAPVIQPQLDERRGSRNLRSRLAVENGLGQARRATADLWRAPCLDRANTLRRWNPRLTTAALTRQLRLWALEELSSVDDLPLDRQFRRAVEKWEAEGKLPRAAASS